jgi:hypothetical protein
MKSGGSGRAEKNLEVAALLLSVLLPLAVFVFGVLGTESISKSGLSGSANEQVSAVENSERQEQW